MDALSMLLENVHLYHTRYYYVHGYGDWAVTLEKKDCIVFYLVVSGGINLSVGATSRSALSSDLVMIPGGRNHVVSSIEPKSKIKPVDLASSLVDDSPEPVVIGQPKLDGKGHVIENGAKTELVVIVCHYDREITRPLLTALPSILPESRGSNEQKQIVLEIGTKFLALESAQNRLGKTTIINRLASIMLIECLRGYIEKLPDATHSWLKALKDPYLSKALAVMHDSPDYNWTIHKLAEVAGMSRSSFAEHFREIVGEPPLTYLTDYRLRLAARYLRLQENSISRISELVGYASDSTFSQAFKRVYGMSPRKYRQQFRNDDSLDANLEALTDEND